jgi:hypothetical protein
MPPESKEPRVHVRISGDLQERVRKVHEKTGLDISVMVRFGLEAIADYFEKYGCVTVPLLAVPQPALTKKQKKQIDEFVMSSKLGRKKTAKAKSRRRRKKDSGS